MTNLASNGESRVKFRNKRWWVSMAGCVLLAIIGLKGLEYAYGMRVGAPGKLDPQFAIAVSILMSFVVMVTGLVYHRIIDEQEERAALWGMTLGFYATTIGGFIWWFLARADMVSPFGFIYVILAGGVIGGAAQLWVQFR